MNAAAAETRPGDDDKPTVLVVEDEVLARLLIADELRLAGFVVIEAVNADEALSVLRNTPRVDLVFTDVRMPGSMDGLALADTVAATWPKVKVILTSGHHTPSAGETHGPEFIAKPYDPFKLVERIGALLASDKK